MNIRTKYLTTRRSIWTRDFTRVELKRGHPFPPPLQFIRAPNTISHRKSRLPNTIEKQTTVDSRTFENQPRRWPYFLIAVPMTAEHCLVPYCRLPNYIRKPYLSKTGHVNYQTFDCRGNYCWTIRFPYCRLPNFQKPAPSSLYYSYPNTCNLRTFRLPNSLHYRTFETGRIDIWSFSISVPFDCQTFSRSALLILNFFQLPYFQ